VAAVAFILRSVVIIGRWRNTHQLINWPQPAVSLVATWPVTWLLPTTASLIMIATL